MLITLNLQIKSLLVLVIVFLSPAIQGQKTRSAENSKQVQVGVNFSPDYDFRTLINNDGSSSSNLVIKSRNDNEVAKFGYTTGLNIFINFSKSLGFETGIQFTNKGYRTKKMEISNFPPIPDLPERVRFVYAYQYIGIPVKARFTTGKGKVRFLASAGVLTNLLIKAKSISISEYTDRKDRNVHSTTSDFKKVDISPLISLGIDYKLNDKIHLIAEPTFRYGLLKTKDTPVSEKLWNTGLNIVFYYGLK